MGREHHTELCAGISLLVSRAASWVARVLAAAVCGRMRSAVYARPSPSSGGSASSEAIAPRTEALLCGLRPRRARDESRPPPRKGTATAAAFGASIDRLVSASRRRARTVREWPAWRYTTGLRFCILTSSPTRKFSGTFFVSKLFYYYDSYYSYWYPS